MKTSATSATSATSTSATPSNYQFEQAIMKVCTFVFGTGIWFLLTGSIIMLGIYTSSSATLAQMGFTAGVLKAVKIIGGIALSAGLLLTISSCASCIKVQRRY